ncbi:exonuclease 1-like protein, partial [Dinothrombium tinctorium]
PRMGINGLLPLLSSATHQVDVRDFRNSIAAIDVYSWLHKGVYSCAHNLYVGETSDAYIDYCLRNTEYLIKCGIKPILVFDGRDLPAKKVTDETRKVRKEKDRKRIDELVREGKEYEARELMKRCVDITHEMAFKLIVELRKRNIDYIVAPYEADAQIAYLLKSGIAHFAITEDSDLLLMDCRFILTKYKDGKGLMICGDQILNCFSHSLDMDKLRRACILSGCDYLSNIKGIGIKGAIKFFTRMKETDLRKVLKRIPYVLSKKATVTDDYIEGFIKAENTFQYQLVFCPFKRKLLPLNEYGPGINKHSLTYAGEYFDDELAFQMAIGNVDVDSMKVNHSFSFNGVLNPKSIWSPKFSIQIPNKIASLFSSSDSKQTRIQKTIKRECTESNVTNKRPKISSDDLVIGDLELVKIYSNMSSESEKTQRTYETSRFFSQETESSLSSPKIENSSQDLLHQVQLLEDAYRNWEMRKAKACLLYPKLDKDVTVEESENEDIVTEDEIIDEMEKESSSSQTSYTMSQNSAKHEFISSSKYFECSQYETTIESEKICSSNIESFKSFIAKF